jgi:ribonuclease E
MANKMLIDATHPEETRVVVLRGNRVEEFDFETAHRKQLRGNIYLAKVTRVEPSLQAAFVEYGGNRHGFLAFSEIHPDYYQIPVADRQALIEADAREAREHDGEDDHHRDRGGRRHRGRHRHHERASARHDDTIHGDGPAGEPQNGDALSAEDIGQDTGERAAQTVIEQDFAERATGDALADAPETGDEVRTDLARDDEPQSGVTASDATPAEQVPPAAAESQTENQAEPTLETSFAAAPIGESENPPVPAEIGTPVSADAAAGEPHAEPSYHTDHPHDVSPQTDDAAPPASTVTDDHDGNGNHDHDEEEDEVVESVGGADAMEEVFDRTPRYRRQYKIQEVIKRRQVMLVQVVKEERGTKGAALTTYLSLAGRYCVLMPNTARGGGISRKITSAEDRKKLREIAESLEVPEGMGVILRTAGAARTKAEVKRDFEYLLRLWEQVRDLTLKSTAPTLVYEEGSLAKRSIRDLYAKDIDEVVVAGEQGYRDCKEFMRMLMPSHAKNVKPYHDPQPIFTRYGIEGQLDAMFSPNVQLRSGGYIVINQTEALVAIDVNSGRSTREHHIEDTALKTNIEAAEEVARQLRLRDLAGLIVIDFIDMDEKRNNRMVERRMKDALRNDRARIQVGRISHFGLLEMSRQRIRTSVLESSTEKCPHCGGTGHVRSVSSVALQLLRALEETLLKGPTHNLIARTRPEVALYALNHKRAHLSALEERFHVTLTVNADDDVGGQVGFTIDRGEQVMSAEQARAVLAQAEAASSAVVEEDEPEIGDAFDGIEVEADEIEHAAHADVAAHEAADEPSMHGESGGESGHDDESAREGGRGRRRRRRRRGRGGEARDGNGMAAQSPDAHDHHTEAGSEPQPFAEDEDALQGESGEHVSVSPAGEDGQPNGHSAEGAGERRRRRGRRGGRRNRRDREGHEGGRDTTQEATFENGAAPQHEANDWRHGEQPAAEAHAFETPASEAQPSWSNGASPPPAPTQPEPAEPTASHDAAPEPEHPPRRRSTVREPAPVFNDTPAPIPMPTPQPAPVVTSAAEADDATKPRRTGWWAKRLLGGK